MEHRPRPIENWNTKKNWRPTRASDGFAWPGKQRTGRTCAGDWPSPGARGTRMKTKVWDEEQGSNKKSWFRDQRSVVRQEGNHEVDAQAQKKLNPARKIMIIPMGGRIPWTQNEKLQGKMELGWAPVAQEPDLVQTKSWARAMAPSRRIWPGSKLSEWWQKLETTKNLVGFRSCSTKAKWLRWVWRQCKRKVKYTIYKINHQLSLKPSYMDDKH
jgi:hypothetical protein